MSGKDALQGTVENMLVGGAKQPDGLQRLTDACAKLDWLARLKFQRPEQAIRWKSRAEVKTLVAIASNRELAKALRNLALPLVVAQFAHSKDTNDVMLTVIGTARYQPQALSYADAMETLLVRVEGQRVVEEEPTTAQTGFVAVPLDEGDTVMHTLLT
jgi:hypothetical protein